MTPIELFELEQLQRKRTSIEAKPKAAASMSDLAIRVHVEQMIIDEAFRVVVQRLARFAPRDGQ